MSENYYLTYPCIHSVFEKSLQHKKNLEFYFYEYDNQNKGCKNLALGFIVKT